VVILCLATLIILLFLFVEYIRHKKCVYSIPIRIHVNGTRGKSSVTRLIAAGLRNGGIRTVAKTTGTLPRLIMPDGKESAIIRLANANIIEQKYIFRHAQTMDLRAIVVECMAVNPFYQWITDRMLVKATISVITNVRLDHVDVMGDHLESIALCLSNTIPEKGVCFTAEKQMYPVLENIAHKRNCRIKQVVPFDITEEEMNAFSYIEHQDNVQLALSVCEYCGIPRAIALQGMQKANPDPGALKRYLIIDQKKKIFFYNVFASNDPDSTAFIYHLITAKLSTNVLKIIILNNRADRFFRSKQLVDMCQSLSLDFLLLTGEIVEKVANYAENKLDHSKIITLGEILPELIYNKIRELTHHEVHVFGIGNIAGEKKYGARIVKEFKQRSLDN